MILVPPLLTSKKKIAVGVHMGYLNETSSTCGPVLRSSTNGNTWTTFTLTKAGKSPQGEDLVEIATYYPPSSTKPR